MKYLLAILLILLSTSAFATTYCLQDLINETSSCGGRDGGNYSISSGGWQPAFNNLQDKDNSTFANGTGASFGWGDMFIQPPVNATGLIIEARDSYGIHNMTLNASCWNPNSIHVLRESLNGFGTNYTVNYYCYNPALVVMYGGVQNGVKNVNINETRLWWIMAENITYNLSCPPKLACLGDSITEGGASYGGDTYERVLDALGNLSSSAFNYGQGSTNMTQWVSWINSTVEADTDYVLFENGIWDTVLNPGQPLSTAEQQYIWIYNSTRAKQAGLIITTILPASDTEGAGNATQCARLVAINSFIRNMSSWSQVTVVDGNALFNNGNECQRNVGLYSDTYHPNVAGYAVLGDAFWGAFNDTNYTAAFCLSGPTTTTTSTTTTMNLTTITNYNTSGMGTTIPMINIKTSTFLMLVALFFITATIFVLGGMGYGSLGILSAVAEADFFVFVFNWLNILTFSLLLLVNIIGVLSWIRRSR